MMFTRIESSALNSSRIHSSRWPNHPHRRAGIFIAITTCLLMNGTCFPVRIHAQEGLSSEKPFRDPQSYASERYGELRGHTRKVLSFQVARKSAGACSVDESGRLIVWDLASRTPRLEHQFPQAEKTRAAWLSADSSLVATLSDGTITVLEVETGKQFARIETADPTFSQLAIYGHGRFVAAYSDTSRTVMRWQLDGEGNVLGAGHKVSVDLIDALAGAWSTFPAAIAMDGNKEESQPRVAWGVTADGESLCFSARTLGRSYYWNAEERFPRYVAHGDLAAANAISNSPDTRFHIRTSHTRVLVDDRSLSINPVRSIETYFPRVLAARCPSNDFVLLYGGNGGVDIHQLDGHGLHVETSFREGMPVTCGDLWLPQVTSKPWLGYSGHPDGTISVWILPRPAERPVETVDAFRLRIASFVEDKNFAALESMATNIRRDQSNFRSGESKIVVFYQSIFRFTRRRWKERLSFIEEWTEAFPNSNVPLTSLANCALSHLSYKSHLWSTNTSSGVPHKEFWKHIRIARHAMKAAEGMGSVDVFFHILEIEIAKVAPAENVDFDQAFADGMRLAPKTPALYQYAAEYLLPRWHGDDNDIRDLSEKVLAALGPELGIEMCALIACHGSRMCGKSVFNETLLSYETTMKGLERLRQRFPVDHAYRSWKIKFAHVANDHHTAREEVSHLTRPLSQATLSPTELSQWRQEIYRIVKWARDTGFALLHRQDSDSDRYVAAEFLSDGFYLLLSDRGILEIRDTLSGKAFHQFMITPQPDRSLLRNTALRVSEDGKRAICAIPSPGHSTDLHLLDFRQGGTRQIKKVSVSGRPDIDAVRDLSVISLRDTENDQLVLLDAELNETHRIDASCHQHALTDDFLWVIDDDQSARQLRHDGTLVQEHGKATWISTSLSRMIVLLGSDTEIRVFNSFSAKSFSSVDFATKVHAAAVTPDRRFMVLAGDDEVLFADLRSHWLFGGFDPLGSRRTEQVSISPAGDKLLLRGEGGISMWNLESISTLNRRH